MKLVFMSSFDRSSVPNDRLSADIAVSGLFVNTYCIQRCIIYIILENIFSITNEKKLVSVVGYPVGTMFLSLSAFGSYISSYTLSRVAGWHRHRVTYYIHVETH